MSGLLISGERGQSVLLPAALLVALLTAAVHLHVICPLFCIHGEAAMTDDICSDR